MGLDFFPCTKPKSINTKKSMNCSFSLILLLHFLLIGSFVCPINSSETRNHQLVNQTIRQEHELHKLITTYLQQINKPAIKTIQSPDGDIIDCVLTHKQPAFDHPLLKGQKPLDPPERPRGDNMSDIFQLWSLSGETCPDGTIPIRRITEQDLLRVDSVSRFGRKNVDHSKQESAYVSVEGDGYTGAKASLNLWRPRTESRYEYSTTQIWIFTENDAIEAGWQVYYDLYGDSRPRLFTYWTADNYEGTGCYNLKCSGFVQTNKEIVIGGSLSPTSEYKGTQCEIALKIWKDQKNGNWWLEFGSGDIVGYWPSSLFTKLNEGEGDFAQFGGEVLNLKTTGFHTSTQMGSGYFDIKGFKQAAYIRNMQVAVNSNNIWIDLPDPDYGASKPNCYDVRRGEYEKEWGNYLFYGGPGRNANCR